MNPSMNQSQLAALESCARRSLTVAERAEAEPLLSIRNDVALAALVSRGRVRPSTRVIGVADVLTAHENAAEMLDEMQTNTDDRRVHYVWRMLDAGRLPIGVAGVVDAVRSLRDSPARAALLALTVEPDPCPLLELSFRLNEAEGRLNFQKV